jgi:hypothetical protein
MEKQEFFDGLEDGVCPICKHRKRFYPEAVFRQTSTYRCTRCDAEAVIEYKNVPLYVTIFKAGDKDNPVEEFECSTKECKV